jgi:Putative peptidoglycan binding domain
MPVKSEACPRCFAPAGEDGRPDCACAVTLDAPGAAAGARGGAPGAFDGPSDTGSLDASSYLAVSADGAAQDTEGGSADPHAAERTADADPIPPADMQDDTQEDPGDGARGGVAAAATAATAALSAQGPQSANAPAFTPDAGVGVPKARADGPLAGSVIETTGHEGPGGGRPLADGAPGGPGRSRRKAGLAALGAAVAVAAIAAAAGTGVFGGSGNSSASGSAAATTAEMALPGEPGGAAPSSAVATASTATASAAASARPDARTEAGGGSGAPSPSSASDAVTGSPSSPRAAGSTAAGSPSPPGLGTPVGAPVLREGDTGPQVVELQNRLSQLLLGYLGSADGIYDSGVKNAVARFQRGHGITADPSGVYGAATRLALESMTKTP